MTDDDLDRDGLRERLGAAAPPHPDLPGLADRVEHRARSRRTTRRAVAGAAVAVALAVLVPVAVTGRGGQTPAGPVASSSGVSTTPVPESCLASEDASRGSLEGTAVWVRFCPGGKGASGAAEVPSDALVTHLEVLGDLTTTTGPTRGPDAGCSDYLDPTYRLQIGYADGRVSEVTGATGPACSGRLDLGISVVGPDGFGVYGTVLRAYGQQYADGFADASVARRADPCPGDPREPGSIDADGASGALDTGYRAGVRSPMVMPLTAVRGVLCTFASTGGTPTVTELTAAQAERVRIGMHALNGAMADCQPRPSEPTYTAVVEDRTGTRRAVTVIESECSAVISSARGVGFGTGFGLGFDWLDR